MIRSSVDLPGPVRAEHADLRSRQERERDVRQHLPVRAVELVDPVHRVDVVAHVTDDTEESRRRVPGQPCRQLRRGVDAELRVRVRPAHRDRVHADEECGCDLLVGAPLGCEHRHALLRGVSVPSARSARGYARELRTCLLDPAGGADLVERGGGPGHVAVSCHEPDQRRAAARRRESPRVFLKLRELEQPVGRLLRTFAEDSLNSHGSDPCRPGLSRHGACLSACGVR